MNRSSKYELHADKTICKVGKCVPLNQSRISVVDIFTYFVCPQFVSLHSDEAIGELFVTKQSRKDRHHVHLVIVPSQAVLRVIAMILEKDRVRNVAEFPGADITNTEGGAGTQILGVPKR